MLCKFYLVGLLARLVHSLVLDFEQLFLSLVRLELARLVFFHGLLACLL